MGKASKLGIKNDDDLYKAIKTGKVSFDELSDSGKKAYKSVMQAKEGRTISPSGTNGFADFRQIDEAQAKDTAKKTYEYKQENPNFLNPYVPGEAYELRQRKAATFTPASVDDSGLKSFGKRLQNQQYATRLLEPVPEWANASTGSKAADTVADFVGFGLGLVGNPGAAGGAVTSLGGGAMKAADYLLSPAATQLGKPVAKLASGRIESGLANLAEGGLAKRTAGRVIHGATAGAGYGAAEGIVQGEDLPGIAKDAGTEALMFGLAEPVFGVGGDVLKFGGNYLKGLGQLRKAPTADEYTGYDLLGETTPEVEGGEYRIKYPTKEPLALPKGKTEVPQSNIPNFELPTPGETFRALESQKPRALPGQAEPLALPEGYYPNWEYGNGLPKADYTVDSMGKAMAKDGFFPPAKIEGVDYVGNTGLQGKQRIAQDINQPIPRSDIGDPAYLSGLKKQYSQMVDAEVQAMKESLGGVQTIGTDPYTFSNGQQMFEKYHRESQNPSWYREWWKKNMRSPREGEWRDLAIKNLVEGNPETGEPANEEFLAALSELSRGQKLPEEWHGLQKSVRDTTAIREPELEPLINDMLAEQAKVEPYGLDRDVGRLNEAENTIRSKTRMDDKGDYGQYEGVRFKRGEGEDYAPTFYSQLQRTIEQKMPNRATTEQIQGIIRGGQVKEEELKWSGLDDFLAERQGQKVTKQEVMDYLKQNDVQVEEVAKGGNKNINDYLDNKSSDTEDIAFEFKDSDDRIWSMDNLQGDWNLSDDKGYSHGEYKTIRKAMEDNGFTVDDYVRSSIQNPSKYSRYQLDGGENYRELLFTMPETGMTNMGMYNPDRYQSGHWEEPNVLAHVRFNDRTGANGEKVLHVEEVQSDWHQEGRRKGYKGQSNIEELPDEYEIRDWKGVSANRYVVVEKSASSGYGVNVFASGATKQEAINNAISNLEKNLDRSKVPDAPFKTTWPEFVMKRMIRYAAENGYDRISFTTGEQQAARYNLSKVVNNIDIKLNENGKYDFYAQDRMGQTVFENSGATADRVFEVLGKDIGRKALDQADATPKKWTVIEGEGLEMGGEGMKGFYDKMIPTWLNKYTKKWGAKVEDSQIDGQGVHSIPITESMRQSVLYEGQPRFKKEQAPPAIQMVLDEAGKETGFEKKWAPNAMKSERFQAANELSKALTGNDIITYTSNETEQGFSLNGRAFLNARSKQPTLYVASHEITHTMEVNSPEHYQTLKNIVIEHVRDDESIINHYLRQSYEKGEIPDELTADVLAECMVQPTFWVKVRDKAPELLKPILDTIDRILNVAKKQAEVPGKYQMMQYMRDVEAMRDRLAVVYQDYLQSIGEVPTGIVRDVAAKAKGIGKQEIVPGDTNTPEFKQWFGDSKVVDEQGKPLVVYHGTGNDFNTFDVTESQGTIWLTSSKDYADTYASNEKKPLEIYATIKEPLDISEYEGEYSLSTWEEILYDEGIDTKKIDWEKLDTDPEEMHPFSNLLGNAGNGWVNANTLEVIKNAGFDGIIAPTERGLERGVSSKKTYVAFSPEQIKSVNNRGTWDATNPDIRFKLGEGGRSPLDDIRSMVEYGASVIKKGGYDHFAKNIEKQFPTQLEGYVPEIKERLMKNIWLDAKKLNDSGYVELKSGGQSVPITKGEVVDKTKTATGNPQDWNHITSKTERNWPKTLADAWQVTKNAANGTYRGTIDDIYRLDQLDKMSKLKTGKGFNADEKAYILALNARESGGTSKAILTDAMYDPQGNKIGDSLASVAKQIPKGTEKDFSNYLIYRHAPSWLEQGRKVFPEGENVTPEVSQQRAAAYEQAHPEFKQIADNLVQWQRDFGKAWLVDTGIIKPETWEMLGQMYPDYIPMQRKMADIEVGGHGVKRGYANQPNPIKKAEGSQRQIIDPIESIIEQVDRYVKVARRNEVMQTLIKNVERDPKSVKDWLEIIPDETAAGKSMDDIALAQGIDGIVDALDQPFQAAMDGKKLRLDRPNVVAGIVNGEKVHVRVSDQSLLDAITNLTPQAANSLVEGVRQVTRTMKVLTTGANVFFASRNIARDLPMSYVQSQTTNSPARWAWGILDSMARVATNGKYDPGQFYQTYKALGGGSHSSSIAADRNLLAESKAAVMPGYYDASKPLTSSGRGLKTAGRSIEAFTNAVETIPRLPEYIRTVKAGGDNYGARQAGLHAAQDVTVNFSRHGGQVEQTADAFIPYLNASLQGIDKIVRAYSSNPVAATAKSVLAISVPAIGLYLINRDDKNYDQLSSWVKDNNFCIPKGDGKFFKIPKPREAGVVFGSLVERCLDKWANDDPEGFKGFSEAWINNFTPPIRTIGAPITDVMRNKNFAGSPIVPGYMESDFGGISPELQYDETTSAPAKAIGKTFNVSPKKVDYLARSYTGFLGEFGIPAASTGRGQSVGQRMGDVLKKTYTADSLYSNDALSDFYDLIDKYNTANSDYKATGKKGEDYNPVKARILSQASTRISNINKQIRQVNGNKGLTYDAKDQKVREMKRRSLDIAQQALGRVKGK